jgi:hypothetical protein
MNHRTRIKEVTVARAKGAVAEEYRQGLEQMRRLRDGEALLEAAHVLLDQLPAGTVVLLGSSTEGVALAALCSALRGEGSSWGRIDLAGPPTRNEPEGVVVVEPVDGGEGWRRAVEARYPGAPIFVAPAGARALAAV